MKSREFPRMEGVTIRLPAELRAKIDNYSKTYKISRSVVLKRAAELFFSTTHCIHCGAINFQGSSECASCHQKLYTDDEILDVMKNIAPKKAAEKNRPYGNDNGYVHTYTPRISVSNKGEMEYLLEYQITLPSGDVLQLDLLNRYIHIDREEIFAELEKAATTAEPEKKDE